MQVDGIIKKIPNHKFKIPKLLGFWSLEIRYCLEFGACNLKFPKFMMLIVGLGNPGRKFEKTRHNFGFMTIDEFQRKNNFPKFKFSKKFKAEVSEGIFNGKKIILAKPQTFMNLSGKSVKSLTTKYLLKIRNKKAMAMFLRRYENLFENLFVIHDDLDLPLGKIRIVKNRGAAGHKGVESIIKNLGTKNFVRFRIGICPKTGKPKNPEKFVLKKFNKEEEKIIKEVIKRTALAIKFSLKEGLEKAMSNYNK